MIRARNARNRAVVGFLFELAVLVGILLILAPGGVSVAVASLPDAVSRVDMNQDELEAHLKPYFEAIVDAIWIAEGKEAARKPYGILSVKCTDKADCRQVCLNTVRNNYWRWVKAGRPGEFIVFLGSRYAPTGKNIDNDPNHLNDHWISNVRRLI